VHHYRQREWIQGILAECEGPAQAFDDWMTRDHLFGREVLRQAKRYDFGTVLVDGTRTIEELADVARRSFGLV
jgi:hypothetical protein